jgi:CheB methylesterase
VSHSHEVLREPWRVATPGLEALSHLLEALPVRLGASLIVVSHLDRSHESLLPEILARKNQHVSEVRAFTIDHADLCHRKKHLCRSADTFGHLNVWRPDALFTMK